MGIRGLKESQVAPSVNESKILIGDLEAGVLIQRSRDTMWCCLCDTLNYLCRDKLCGRTIIIIYFYRRQGVT